MARYTGADCKLCRREKVKLFLKGSKCDSPKCPIEIRPYPPGEHGRIRQKDSEYLLQIREKQKARRIYGVLEKQFRGYYAEAAKKSGRTGETLLQDLECQPAPPRLLNQRDGDKPSPRLLDRRFSGAMCQAPLVRGRQMQSFSEWRPSSISLRFIVRAAPGSVARRTLAPGTTGSNSSS